MLIPILFLLNEIWVDLKIGSVVSSISMNQYNEGVKDANDSYDKYEWQDTTLKVFGRIPEWNKARSLFYPQVIIGKRYERPLGKIELGCGLGINPIFTSTNSVIGCGYITHDTVYNYWRRKMEFDLYSIPVLLSSHIEFESRILKFITRVGIGWYPAFLLYNMERYAFSQSPDTFQWNNISYNAALFAMNGIGLDGDIGVSFSPVKFLTISCGFTGRIAKITGFEGNYTKKVDGVETTGKCVISYWYWKKEGEHKWGIEDKKVFEEAQNDTPERTAHEKGAVELTGRGVFFWVGVRF